MKKWTNFAVILLHLILAAILIAATSNNTSPEDTLVAKVSYEKQAAYFQIWEDRTEAIVDGKRYDLSATPYRNAIDEWEVLESPTGNFIRLRENGVTECTLGGKHKIFLPE